MSASDGAFAAVQRDWPRDEMRIWAGYKHGGQITIISGDGTRYLEIADGAEIRQSIALPEDVARALYDELGKQFHGNEDTRTLRRDYDAERGRVDKLTDALVGIAARATYSTTTLGA